jgi:hypothetical protein
MLYGGRGVVCSGTELNVGLQRFIDVPVGLLTALIDKCGCCGMRGQETVHLEDVRVDEGIILKCT